ncbi:fluoride efflux transporter CrcB [Ignicoccus hospitalis]|uniref:Fluoride-specific ion channel FluC n=1 Tax=Ignicoccus hospitalis (strain KIN4/I / DSM 18386 / JCM 14125) TaxID=453591 RepID=FLUC_IGNH4|nr:fluoride efflux transporter CrcB [Ignicoccus hospitalis]A8AAZ9.1 RecName: Full=Fluoride-specific ion channel FluC [Ignicoccus hospitalis KIN4/I]ABU82101.1 camphor resistance protein CrcB [Ignicoccus hospitalis KIN4/I]HIH91059.1 fluoride efflux transporter CrcB [Desulfurococcaceae archaeon]
MKALVWVAVGGALGAIVRYFFYKFVPQVYDFPLATFLVNVVASFLLGFIIGAFEAKPWGQQLKLALATGFCGALSTFSTFAADNYILLRSSKYITAFVYTAVSVGLGIVSVALGEDLAQRLLK